MEMILARRKIKNNKQSKDPVRKKSGWIRYEIKTFNQGLQPKGVKNELTKATSK